MKTKIDVVIPTCLTCKHCVFDRVNTIHAKQLVATASHGARFDDQITRAYCRRPRGFARHNAITTEERGIQNIDREGKNYCGLMGTFYEPLSNAELTEKGVRHLAKGIKAKIKFDVDNVV